MMSLDRPRALAAAAVNGSHWLAALLARQRMRLAVLQPRLDDAEASDLWLEERILATRTDIAAINRSLAMQKQALDGAWPGRVAVQVAAQSGTHPAAPASPDRPADDGSSAYADTEPLPFLDTITPAPDAAD